MNDYIDIICITILRKKKRSVIINMRIDGPVGFKTANGLVYDTSFSSNGKLFCNNGDQVAVIPGATVFYDSPNHPSVKAGEQ